MVGAGQFIHEEEPDVVIDAIRRILGETGT
jgi:hypothetical protein